MGKLDPENSPVAAHPDGLVAIAEQNQASALLVRLAGCGDHSVLDHYEFGRLWLYLLASKR